MRLHQATKVVIITEKMLAKGVCDIIEACGARGYTMVAAGGKGHSHLCSTAERASIIEEFANVRIEVIVNDRATAESIMTRIADRYFSDYSGVTYLQQVEVLRPLKF